MEVYLSKLNMVCRGSRLRGRRKRPHTSPHRSRPYNTRALQATSSTYYKGDSDSRPIRINLNPCRGFRRGEGGWVDVEWAFMVAREWGYCPFIDKTAPPSDPRRATMKAHPSPHHPPSPLRTLMSFSSG